MFRFTGAVRQAWLLSSDLVAADRDGWLRPSEDAFVRAFQMHGYAEDFARRAWAEYDGASGDDPRQAAITDLTRDLLTVGRAQAICGGKVNSRLHV